MTTSGSSDFSLNAGEVITDAFDLIGIYPGGRTPSAADSVTAMRVLNRMLKTWSLRGPYLWTKKRGTVTLTANTASFNLAAQLNPLRILSIRYRDANGRDLPMSPMPDEAYFDIPVKTSTGIPACWYFDPQRGAPTLYIWPLLSSVTTETLQVTYQRRIEDVDALTDDIDIPQEELETVSYALAARLLDSFSIPNADIAARVTQRAAMLAQEAMDFEREPFIDFIPERR